MTKEFEIQAKIRLDEILAELKKIRSDIGTVELNIKTLTGQLGYKPTVKCPVCGGVNTYIEKEHGKVCIICGYYIDKHEQNTIKP